MRTREKEQQFINRLQNEIKNRETLRQSVSKIYLPLLEKFDGKVYNKRFENVLKEALKDVSQLMFANCTMQAPNFYSNFPKNWAVQVTINIYNIRGDYTDKETYYTNIVLNAGRIDAKSSRIEEFSIVWAENFDKETDERKAILKNYDYYLTAAEDVAKAIENYKNLPFRFRKNIEFDEKFYLS